MTDEDKQWLSLTVAELVERNSPLMTCSPAELKVAVRDAIYNLEVALAAMISRGVDPKWWDPEGVYERIAWIAEEYGWDADRLPPGDRRRRGYPRSLPRWSHPGRT